jgi:hypothetical protein
MDIIEPKRLVPTCMELQQSRILEKIILIRLNYMNSELQAEVDFTSESEIYSGNCIVILRNQMIPMTVLCIYIWQGTEH